MSSPITVHWFLPTFGDSRTTMSGGDAAGIHYGERAGSLSYLTQLVVAAESNGVESVLTPTGMFCEDAWVAAAALIARTSRLKFLVAVRPGLVSPTVIAQQAATFQKLSGGRLNINVVVGGEDDEQRAFGDDSTKEQRYWRADEVLRVVGALWRGETVDFDGEYVQVEGAKLKDVPVPVPPIFFGGSSPTGIEVASRHAQVYLTWGEPPAQAAEKIERVRDAARVHGRALEYGIRLHVIARDTADQAWAVAQKLIDAIDPEDVRQIQRDLHKSQSEGQRRMTEIQDSLTPFNRGTNARDLEIAPNLWAGVGLVRGGAGTALVGSYEEVAQRIVEYQDVGFNHFVLSGYPHLEESFHVGEGVIPALKNLGASLS